MVFNQSESMGWIEPLSQRELEILGLMSDGLSNREIALRLSLSVETVKWYNKQLYAKLGVSSRGAALAKARTHQLMETSPGVSPGRAGSASNNLPAQLTSFIGRTREVDEILRLLKTARLVTLTGPGGTGKTRLALQAARHLEDAYRDGIWLVELAAVAAPDFVPTAIAETLQVINSGDMPLSEVLKRYLKHKHMLLLMDNFEHLLPAAPLVGELLAAAPQLSVLATSRERLHIYGEQEYAVHPLSLPEWVPGSEMPVQNSEALDLFLQRARAARSALKVDADQLAAVAQICMQLDGLPLAIELAATQVKYWPLDQLAARLRDQLAAPSGGPRDLPARQRTLRATIEWSYDLLGADERALFAQLAIFNGGGTLEAVQAICAPDKPQGLMDVLSALVDKNLLLMRPGLDGEIRFGMLETIRTYALERLADGRELEQVQHRHAAYYTNLTQQAAREMRGARQVHWFTRLRTEGENIRAVLSWSLAGEQTHYGLSMAVALRDYWYYSGFAAEGRQWLALALEKSGPAPLDLRADVLCAAGEIAYCLGDQRQAIELQQQALEIYQQVGEKQRMGWCLVFLSSNYVGQADETPRGFQLCQQGMELLRQADDLPGLAMGFNILGELARSANDYEAAGRYYEQCLEIVRQTGEQLRVAILWENLSYVAFYQQRYRQAAEFVVKAIKIVQEMHNQYGLSTFLEALAGPLAMLGAPELAARLLGASRMILETLGIDTQPGDLSEIQQYYRVVRSQMGEAAFQAAWEAGRTLSLESAVEMALSSLPVETD